MTMMDAMTSGGTGACGRLLSGSVFRPTSIITMLARFISIMLLGAMILTGSLAQAHDAVMGDTLVLRAQPSNHGDHLSHETDRPGNAKPCEICGAALLGDCTAALCHPELIVETRDAPTGGAKLRHHSSQALDQPGINAEVRTPPPRHLLEDTTILFPQETV